MGKATFSGVHYQWEKPPASESLALRYQMANVFGPVLSAGIEAIASDEIDVVKFGTALAQSDPARCAALITEICEKAMTSNDGKSWEGRPFDFMFAENPMDAERLALAMLKDFFGDFIKGLKPEASSGLLAKFSPQSSSASAQT